MESKPVVRVAAALGIVVAVGLSGCAVCQDCHDYTPPVVGGSVGSTATGSRAGSAVGSVTDSTIVSDAAIPVAP